MRRPRRRVRRRGRRGTAYSSCPVLKVLTSGPLHSIRTTTSDAVTTTARPCIPGLPPTFGGCEEDETATTSRSTRTSTTSASTAIEASCVPGLPTGLGGCQDDDGTTTTTTRSRTMWVPAAQDAGTSQLTGISTVPRTSRPPGRQHQLALPPRMSLRPVLIKPGIVDERMPQVRGGCSHW